MNVTSRSLCEELYLLSKWDDTDFVWFQDYQIHRDMLVGPKELYGSLLPSYDLGYLLRKLPTTRVGKTTKGKS